MPSNWNIDDEIAQTLASFQTMERAKPRPFFWGRVQTRLNQRRSGSDGQPGWLFRPALLVGLLGIVVLLNGSTAVYVFRHRAPVSSRLSEGEASALAVELGIDTASLNW